MHIGFKNGGNARFMEPFHTFPPNTHKRYSLRHCITIGFILQKKNHINSWTVVFGLNKEIEQLFLKCPFWYCQSTV